MARNLLDLLGMLGGGSAATMDPMGGGGAGHYRSRIRPDEAHLLRQPKSYPSFMDLLGQPFAPKDHPSVRNLATLLGQGELDPEVSRTLNDLKERFVQDLAEKQDRMFAPELEQQQVPQEPVRTGPSAEVLGRILMDKERMLAPSSGEGGGERLIREAIAKEEVRRKVERGVPTWVADLLHTPGKGRRFEKGIKLTDFPLTEKETELQAGTAERQAGKEFLENVPSMVTGGLPQQFLPKGESDLTVVGPYEAPPSEEMGVAVGIPSKGSGKKKLSKGGVPGKIDDTDPRTNDPRLGVNEDQYLQIRSEAKKRGMTTGDFIMDMMSQETGLEKSDINEKISQLSQRLLEALDRKPGWPEILMAFGLTLMGKDGVGLVQQLNQSRLGQVSALQTALQGARGERGRIEALGASSLQAQMTRDAALQKQSIVDRTKQIKGMREGSEKYLNMIDRNLLNTMNLSGTKYAGQVGYSGTSEERMEAAKIQALTRMMDFLILDNPDYWAGKSIKDLQKAAAAQIESQR